jgi:hypothetical protein
MSAEPFEIQGLEEFRQRLGAVGNEKGIARVATNALRRGARRIVSATVKEEKNRGVLKTIFAKDTSGLRKLVKAGRVELVGGQLECKITLKGLAAIQESGGRTAPHVIEPKTTGKMAFTTHGQFIVTGKRVNHPGAQHPAIPIFANKFREGQPATIEDLRASFEDYILKAWARG